jgi:hypothetical protein
MGGIVKTCSGIFNADIAIQYKGKMKETVRTRMIEYLMTLPTTPSGVIFFFFTVTRGVSFMGE